MFIINATVLLDAAFLPGMRIRLEQGCIAAIGAESAGKKVCGHMVAGSPVPLTRWSKDRQFISIVEA